MNGGGSSAPGVPGGMGAGVGATAPLGFSSLAAVGSMAGYSPAAASTASAGMNDNHAAHAAAAAAAAAAHHPHHPHTQMGGYDLVAQSAQHGFASSFQHGHFGGQNYYHQGK